MTPPRMPHYFTISAQPSHATDHHPRQLPITIPLLRHIKVALSQHPHLARQDKLLYWAAFTLAFYGFLHVSERTSPSTQRYNPWVHLLRQDIAIHPDHIKLSIKGSKTDQFRQSATVVIGATDNSTCPVCAMTRYLLATNGHASHPLSTLHDGSFLTCQAVSRTTKCILSTAGVDTTRLSSHSYCIGAATAAAAVGFPETLIQNLGRWCSTAYKRYVRSSQDTLHAAAHAIAHHN